MTTTNIGRSLSLTRTTTTLISTTSHQACTWEGHCLGAACSSNDDCDNDWICLNKVCSPCCETAGSIPTSSATTLPTSGTATSRHKKLSTGAAIGIGIGVVALLAIVVGIACWIWHVRRRRALRKGPANHPVRPRVNTSNSLPDDRKQLIQSRVREELPCPSNPTELHAKSVELVELEGDHGKTAHHVNEAHKQPLAPPKNIALRPRYRFEEHAVSPQAQKPGEPSLSPVSDVQSNTPSAGQRDWQPRMDNDGQNTMAVAQDGSDSTYTLFRWPDRAYSSASGSHR